MAHGVVCHFDLPHMAQKVADWTRREGRPRADEMAHGAVCRFELPHVAENNRRVTRVDSSLWPQRTVPKLPSGTNGCQTLKTATLNTFYFCQKRPLCQPPPSPTPPPNSHFVRKVKLRLAYRLAFVMTSTDFYTTPFIPNFHTCLILLHQPALTPDTFDTNQLFTPDAFYTKHLTSTDFYTTPFIPNFHTCLILLHQPALTPDTFDTNQLLHETPFTPTSFYTRQLLQSFTQDTLYTRQTALTRGNFLHHKSFYTRHLLHQTPWTPNTLYINRLLHHIFQTKHLLHQAPFRVPQAGRPGWIRASDLDAPYQNCLVVQTASKHSQVSP